MIFSCSVAWERISEGGEKKAEAMTEIIKSALNPFTEVPLDVNYVRLYDNLAWFGRGMRPDRKPWGKVEVHVDYQPFQITQKFVKIILDKEYRFC
jgi:hypothetical protein